MEAIPMDDEQRPTLQLTRREFGKLAGVSGIGLSLSGGVTSALAAGGEKVNPAKIIKGKSPDMIVHNAKLGVMETPLTLLREHNITPKNIMYNRTHFPV
ncbi:MAG TPA: hypothetical protein VKA48_06735, partial [Gammaproteobacteria bacterium]|nr:hypothetical protein [Gammaproteobacteria bacterium]